VRVAVGAHDRRRVRGAGEAVDQSRLLVDPVLFELDAVRALHGEVLRVRFGDRLGGHASGRQLVDVDEQLFRASLARIAMRGGTGVGCSTPALGHDENSDGRREDSRRAVHAATSAPSAGSSRTTTVRMTGTISSADIPTRRA